MKFPMRAQHRIAAIAVGSGLLAGVCWAAGIPTRLVINHQVASTDVRMIDGKAFAPVSDIARALGQSVVLTRSSIELINEA